MCASELREIWAQGRQDLKTLSGAGLVLLRLESAATGPCSAICGRSDHIPPLPPTAKTRPRRADTGRSGGDLTKCKTAGVDCEADGGKNAKDGEEGYDDGDDVGAGTFWLLVMLVLVALVALRAMCAMRAMIVMKVTLAIRCFG